MPIAERQIGSGQDYAACGEVDDMRYAFVADGHGTNRCINYIRSVDPNLIASQPNPAQYLFDNVAALGDTTRSGFTFTFARVVKKSDGGLAIQVYNVGDSETHVHVNDVLVHKTTPHTFLNPVEVERTKPLMEQVIPTCAPFPVSPTRVELVLSPEGIFNTGERLAMSMAFGHNNMTGFEPSYWEVNVAETDKIHIVCGSDGFFGMLVTDLFRTADELADEAADRWQQQWNFFDGVKTVRTNYGGGYDDVAVAII